MTNIRKDVCFKSVFSNARLEGSNNSGIASGDLIDDLLQNGDYLVDGDDDNDERHDQYGEYNDVINSGDTDEGRQPSGCITHCHSFICIVLAGVIMWLAL